MKKTRIKTKKCLHIIALSVSISLALLFANGVECNAQGADKTETADTSVDGILEDFGDTLPQGMENLTDISSVSDSLGVKRILSSVFSSLEKEGGELFGFVLTLLGIALLSSLCAVGNSEIAPASSRAVGIISSAMLFERLYFIFSCATESLKEIGEFFAAVIPITVAVNSLGVSPTLASTQALGMGLTLGAYSFVGGALLTAVVGAIFVSAAVSSIDPIFSRIAKGVKATFLSLVGIFTALVGATFSLQSTVSVSADSALMRSARYALSGTVPIVGAAVSGALGLVTGGAAYARGIVGGGAIAAVIALVISPLVTLFSYRICLKMGVFFSSFISSGGCAEVMSAFLGALDSLIAVYCLTAVIYIVELVAFLKGGVGIA